MANNSAQIKRILDDLYAIDPGLKAHEKALVQLIAELLSARPDTKFDARVAEDLRRKVMAKADMLSSEYKTTQITKLSFMKKLNIVFGGLATVAVVAALVVYTNKDTATPFEIKDTPAVFSDQLKITPVSSNAFGNLAMVNSGGNGRGGGGTEFSSNSGLGSSGSNSVSGAPQADPKMIAPAPGADVSIMPPFVNYKYVYAGDDIELPDTELPVFRRVKGLPSGASADQILRSMNFGLIDMGKFNNTSVESINIVEDKEWGYNFYINFREGTMSLSENWWRWPTPDKQCRDEACYQSLRLKISDVPSDNEVLAIAERFMSDHSIPTGQYGQPFVQTYWREEYERMQDKSQYYIPDVVTVTYPLKVNGEEVYDESGSKTGLSVSVNIRTKRVSGLYELSSQQYESSNYAAETSADRILQVAEKGGFRGHIYYGLPEGLPGARTETQTVELGTPTRSVVKFWMSSDNGLSNELLVPALIFPVTKGPSGDQYYYRRSVVVPLVKEVLNSDLNQPGGEVRPLM